MIFERQATISCKHDSTFNYVDAVIFTFNELIFVYTLTLEAKNHAI